MRQAIPALANVRRAPKNKTGSPWELILTALACADGVAPTYIGATDPGLTSPVAIIIRQDKLSVKHNFC